MRIKSVVSIAQGNLGRSVAFERKLKEEEKKDYTKTITDTMDYLGIVNRAMIIHGSSFPSDKEKDAEVKIGSPYGAQNFLDFIELHGFNAVQLGPTGKLNRGDTSPYSSSVFAKNPLFIDFTQLTTGEYAHILSENDLFEETYPVKKTNKNYARTDYKEAQEINNILLRRAYNNYKRKVNENDKEALRLKNEFTAFQQENAQWLEYYSVLDVIAKSYGTDYYPYWDKEDAELIQKVKQGNSEAIDKYNEIKFENNSQIEAYKFSQFLIDKQSRQDDKNRGQITYISDLLVGVSSFDEMIYADIFKKGYKIGASTGGAFNSPQLWDISLIDPDKLFNKDGSLGSGGEFIKLKLKKAMSDATNVRIDHAMGLVDPYIYNPKTIVYAEKEDENGELVKYPIREKLQAGYLSQFNFDKNRNYQRIIPEIIIPTMKELGIDPKEAVWEDLGSDETGVFNRVFRQENNLPGINVLAWDRGEESKPNNWAYVNGHDNEPTIKTAQKDGIEWTNAWNLDYLSGYLNPNPARYNEKEAFKYSIAHDSKELLKAKFADLMRSTKNIQISFMDFFGINKRYNTPGTTGNHNWTLRLNPDYEDTYYKSLSKNGTALNMPEVLSIALQAKSDMDIVRGEKSENQSQREIGPLMEKLKHYSNVLKE